MNNHEESPFDYKYDIGQIIFYFLQSHIHVVSSSKILSRGYSPFGAENIYKTEECLILEHLCFLSMEDCISSKGII